jgi:translocation and assembly module TamB
MRALRWLCGVVGTLVVFVLSVVGGVLLHSNTPSARRLAVSEVNSILAPSFQGRIRVDSLGRLSLFGLSGANLTIEDPTGRPVLVARGVRVRIATLDALRSVLMGKTEPVTVRLSDVSIDTLDVRLDTDEKGQLDLVNAFAPRTPSAPATVADPTARGFRLTIPRIAWKHAWVHGLMAGVPPVDADVDDFRGAFTYSPEALEGDVAQAKIIGRHIANGADVVGSLDGHVRQPSDPTAKLEAHAHWVGVAAGIQHSAQASIVDDRVDAVVDVPRTEPAKIRALWPGSPIERSTKAHVEAHGSLADADVVVHAGVGEASLDARGKLSFAAIYTAKLTLEARDIDVHELAASAPITRLGLTGAVSADRKPDGVVSGEVNLRFLGGKVGTNVVPAASIRGSGSLSAARQVNAVASVVVDEPGAPTHLDLRVFPKAGSSAVHFDLAAKSVDLDRVPELRHALRGSFGVFATGELDVGPMTIDGQVRGAADGIVQGATRVESATIEGSAEGAIAAPRIELAVRARGIVAGGLHFTSAAVDARGSTSAAHVTSSVRGPDAPDMDASADIGLGHVVSVDALRVALARRGQRALVTARKVMVGGGDVRVDDGRIEGIGEPMTVSLAMTPGTLRVLAATRGLDLASVARLASIEKNLKGGTLSFDTDLRLQRQGAAGRMTLDLKQAALGTVTDVTGHVEASLEGRRVAAKAHVEASGIGSVDVDAPKVELASGETMSVAAWRGAWGAIDIDANTDLATATALIPPDQLPVSRARGKVHIKGHLARDDARDFTPDLTLSVTTEKLELAAKTPTSRDIDGVLVFPPPAWHIEGIDLVVDGHIDGHSGALRLSTQAHDTQGPLAQLDLGSKQFPYAEALHDTASLETRLRTTPFDVHLVIPERGLGKVPAILKQSYVTGRLQADVKASGTLLAPKVDVTASLRRADYTGNGASGLPLDLDVVAHYDGARGTASVKAHSADKELLDLEAQVDAAVAGLLAWIDSSTETSPAWKASARAHVTGYPLASIALLDDKLVAGQLSGDISVADLHANAHADATLTIDALSVGSVTYKSASIHLKGDGHVLDGTVRIDQTDGFVETKAHAPASWGAAMVPALDPAQPLDFNLSAKNFRIAALLPFVDGTLDELDGRLDAETHVQLDPSKNTAQASGTMALSSGTVEAVAGGGELHDIAASLKLAPDGTLTLERLTAKGLTGQLEASGTAKLDGVTLQSAKAVIVIPSHSAMPLTASGTEVGNVDGRIEVSELTSEGGKAMDVKVEIPQLRIALPEGSSTDPQALGEMAKVRIGAHRGDPLTFVLLPLDPVQPVAPPTKAGATKLTMEAHLGDVEVIRGTQLKVNLDGRVNVVNGGGAAQVTGQIHLKRGGVLDVQGKKFTVEDGTVTLVGADPSNPEVVVKASWTAPEGTVVYAVFDGPLKTGKVTLSSEPTLPQQEIVELLLFGTADGTQAQGATPADSAIGTASGQAAQPLNHALGQLGLGAVSAKIDTTEAANPRPEVEVQIARDISIQIAVVLGQPPPGVNPDHTLLTIDWRFLTKWSLASTVGDAGTTIFDLLWQRRY